MRRRSRSEILGRVALAVVLAGPALAGCNRPRDAAGLPEDVIRKNSRGTAHLGQANWAAAETAFREAAALRPNDALLQNNVAVALLAQGRNDEAAAFLERALELDPGFAPAHFNAGLVAKSRADFAQAAAHFAAVVEHDPNDVASRFQLAQALTRTGRDAETREAFDAALALDPQHVSTLYAFGQFLLRTGEAERGRQLVTRSAELRARTGLGMVVGSQYGEQGPYALGIDYPGDALAAPEPLPVRYVPATETSLSTPAEAGPAWALARDPSTGAPVLVLADGQRLVVLAGTGAPRPGGTLPASSVLALAAGDLDDDGRGDLVAATWSASGPGLVVLRAGADGWEPRSGGVSAALGPPTPPTAADLAVVDRDHDGDLDVFACFGGSTCLMATNDGTGELDVRTAAEHGIRDRGAPGSVQVAISDVDNDRDIDLLRVDPDGLQVFANLRDGTFAEATGLAGPATEGTALAVADLDKDGWMDVALGGRDEVRLAFRRGGRLEAGPFFPFPARDLRHVLVFDHDNDGFLDVLAAGPNGTRLARNRGARRWQENALAADAVPPSWIPFAAFDADADGDMDLAARSTDGRKVAILAASGAERRHWIAVDPRGLADNRNGIGAKVWLLSGALQQKLEVTGVLPPTIGLGDRTQVDSVRLLWPGGVLQDEIGLAPDRLHVVEQLDRKGTSCPLLYAWAGAEWRFVTDFLGGAAVGYQLAPGVFNTPDRDEYVKIEGGIVEDAAGQVRLRVNNQLEEVIWFDALALVAVDHPRGTEVFPNERLMPGPPWPEFELFAGSDVRSVVAARDVEHGTDRLAELSAVDRRYAGDFALLPYKGYAASHTLELDLGEFADADRLVLLLDGWIDYADSSANVAAGQAGVQLSPPALAVADGRGGWLAMPPMGFPAGLPKTMAVELTGAFRSPDHRVRIATNMRIHWDRARVLVGGATTPLELRRVAALSAELRSGGFPRPVSPDGRMPQVYDPRHVAPRSSFKAHAGSYTAFGDVRERLLHADDRFVTTRNGDEIELRFEPPPPPRAGFVRTWLLHAEGYGKDMDPNSAASDEVAPIPFRGMPSYPYPDRVAPPREAPLTEPGTRLVPRSDEGLHGVVPQTLLSER